MDGSIFTSYLNQPSSNIGFYSNVQSISPQGSLNYQNLLGNSNGGNSLTTSGNSTSGGSNNNNSSGNLSLNSQSLTSSGGIGGTKKCTRCFKLFYASDFYQPTCSYHTDLYVKMEERWKCCNRKGKDAGPCFSTYHIEDETTSNILQSMTIPKPEIIQQNNPIFQGGNYGYIGAEKILYESILKKQGKTLGRWAKRKFRLTQSTLINYYDESEAKVHRVFQLADISINYKKHQIDGDFRLCMVINDGTRNHLLYSPIQSQTEAWINALITQKKILVQSRSNQLLQSNTPQYPPFPLSSSPPKYQSYLTPSTSSINSLYPGTISQVQQQNQPPPPPQQTQVYVYLQQPPPQQPIYQQQQDWDMTGNNNNNNNNNTNGNTTQNVQWVQHHVSPLDTLAGIAIRYNTSIDVIKRINLIKNNQVIAHQTLLVPLSTLNPYTPPPPQQLSEEERRRKLVQLFAVSENISKDEARSYLCNNDWDIAKAIKELKDDLDWEQSHPFKSNN